METGQFRRIDKVSQPLKGSFPLDYEGNCKLEMLNYMMCLKRNKCKNSECRNEAKSYFACRMDKGLMDKDEWQTLGYKDVDVEKN
uniref:Cytochrome c oxidase assembly protein COX19 (inferred by orthology to a human protein) n=1 Tax=Strongyloides venezuelensis TaxID=75913 RepID=A0A0K0FPP1_STRVS